MAYSVDDVRRSYTREKARAERAGDLPAYLLYRPLSFHLAALLLRLGVPPLAVTYACASIAPAIVWCAYRGGERAYLIVVALGLAFHVLDCVDGNMARTTRTETRFGALMDGIADRLFWVCLLWALGVLAERSSTGWLAARGVELGLGAAVLTLLGRVTRDHFSSLAGVAALPAAGDERATGRDRLLWAVAGLEHVYVLAVLAGGAAGRVDVVLAIVVGYAAAVAIASSVIVVAKSLR